MTRISDGRTAFLQRWEEVHRDGGGIATTLGIEPISADETSVRMRMPWSPEVSQVAGYFSAPALFGLADICATWMALVHVAEGTFPLLVQSSTNLVSNTSRGFAYAEAGIVKAGRTLVVATVTITDERGAVLATATNTMVPR